LASSPLAKTTRDGRGSPFTNPQALVKISKLWVNQAASGAVLEIIKPDSMNRME
jgi:hypothetical protein